MKKICVLGAGISGMSFARIAAENFEVEILERNSTFGGIARTQSIEGLTYHPVGGHCFNSKFPEVMSFVFDKILAKDNWHSVTRDAVIKIDGQEIGYPIEYSVKEIYKRNPELALNITKDFLSSIDDGNYASLEDWFRKKFGNTLADLYFIPYNRKIWKRDPSDMSPEWVEGKLPIPDKTSFFQALLEDATDKMPHSNFYYPNSNNQNSFIDALAVGCNITCNYKVDKISYNKSKNTWIVNDEKEYDLIVSTIPLNMICGILQDTPKSIIESSNKLKYNSVTTMFWSTEPTSRTWTYIPGSENFFHRYIHIGNFFLPKKDVSITEVIGNKSYDEMVENGRKDPFLKEPLAYNVSEHAYVVFDQNYKESVNQIKDYLKSIGVYSLGRFGEWEYYNMDICIKKGMDLHNELRKLYDI